MNIEQLINDVLQECDDRIKGGLADHKSLQDIADKHNKSLDYIKQMLKMGIKVEREHTSDPEIAKEIAKDHLMEDADYYKKLKKMEKD